MSESYSRESQNNALLTDLASKVTALRGVTVDIYDQARDHQVIDHSVRFPPSPTQTRKPLIPPSMRVQNEVFANFQSSLKQSVSRVRLMAQNSSNVQIVKLSASIVACLIVLWILWGWFLG
jgi:blocked-early-in-transport protein 1